MIVVRREDIVCVVVPCPRCGSWNTKALDDKKEVWACCNANCQTPFMVRNHYALVFLRDGRVVKTRKCV
ncbi:MAG: hypothetical protein OH337_04100 [Candidatus Parvarchaeota archaeon]|nr:hypothetical protein [Candidatus Haiyanarchaeum thermophilum]